MCSVSIPRIMACVVFAAVLTGGQSRAADDPVPLRRVAVATVPELTAAIEAARPGDDIVLAPGTYEVGKLRLAAAGTEAHPVRLRAERRGSVAVRASGVEAFLISAPRWIVQGLDIRGVCDPQKKCEHAFHIAGDANHTVIRGNRARDFNAALKSNDTDYPVAGAGGDRTTERLFPDNVLIEGNYFFNTTGRETESPVTMIDVVGGRNWIVRGNFVADFQKSGGNKVSYGLFLKGNSRNGVIERNLVICEWQHAGDVRIGISLGGGGSGPPKICEGGDCSIEHTNGIIRNNIVLDCTRDSGIYLHEAKDTKIYNNTVINTAGIDIRFKASSADVRNNIVSGTLRDRDGATHTEAHNLVHRQAYTLLRMFADPQNGNFRLLNEREIMGQGRRVPEVTDDFCGRPRRLPAYDLGAIEFGPGRCGTAEMMREARAFGG